ncbi:MAG: cell division protein SepF [Acetatifactor sp.]|nr:cell division protein SepF [Acetatifactor sp.]
MGVMDKFLNYMKLNGDDEDEYFDEDYLDDDEEVEPAPAKKPQVQKLPPKQDDYHEDRPVAKKPAITSKITPMKQNPGRKVSNQGMEVCVIRPTSVDDAREITDTLLANRTVVLNLEGLDVDVAQRIIDFTSGSTYAIQGGLQKISHYIFIITPSNVDISGDIQDIFGGAFGLLQ